MKNNSTVTSGVTGAELLQVAFIVLKLCHVINWKWIWVLAPTWISAIIVVVCIAIYVIADVWLKRRYKL